MLISRGEGGASEISSSSTRFQPSSTWDRSCAAVATSFSLFSSALPSGSARVSLDGEEGLEPVPSFLGSDSVASGWFSIVGFSSDAGSSDVLGSSGSPTSSTGEDGCGSSETS